MLFFQQLNMQLYPSLLLTKYEWIASLLHFRAKNISKWSSIYIYIYIWQVDKKSRIKHWNKIKLKSKLDRVQSVYIKKVELFYCSHHCKDILHEPKIFSQKKFKHGLEYFTMTHRNCWMTKFTFLICPSYDGIYIQMVRTTNTP